MYYYYYHHHHQYSTNAMYRQPTVITSRTGSLYLSDGAAPHPLARFPLHAPSRYSREPVTCPQHLHLLLFERTENCKSKGMVEPKLRIFLTLFRSNVPIHIFLQTTRDSHFKLNSMYQI
jgi:hypothetical protein